ncbi:hypothetical protein [Streptococcus sanguinis]|jgi:hypothetical protein|uniref:Lipoprotein, putative n=1 Tax=Streptococcus sanguinis TaxID=1305 RepID=A0A2X3VRJ3_STRSA|nr:hypothetical protein [Streptococcus sanguinis]EGJ42581.1 lipoprotein [Streptococcus sanguinis SK1059]EGQ18850.1 protein of hypothetical function/lipoprotein [Streptococcus sanguinis ATCC 29667]EGQ25295.1 protein of hypothetical function/lipoprotein [Streptococcus sanguinis SK340]MCY7014434.1 hypothetical protein [Streptococcus sanguinis]SQF36077.1 lipoprotein, putative [Streptococcus sanguinis]
MKKHKMIWLVLIALFIGGGSLYMFSQGNLFSDGKANLRTSKDKQLDYLKKHQDEIKNFVKSQNPKIDSVQIDWAETQWNQVGNGTPQGAGDIIDVYGTFNNIENSGWHVMIDVPEGEFNIRAMTLVNYLSVGGEEFE